MDILLAEANGALADALERTLALAGHDVFVSAAESRLMREIDAHAAPFDVAVLDTNMSAVAAGRLAKAVRRRDPDTPILLIRPFFAGTGRGFRRLGNVIPHDAELFKPFSTAEFMSRIRALSPGVRDGGTPTVLTHGALTLDTANRRAFYGDEQRPLALSAREYAALEALIRADGRFMDFDELHESVFGPGRERQRQVMSTTLYGLIRKLRRVGFFVTHHGDRYRIL